MTLVRLKRGMVVLAVLLSASTIAETDMKAVSTKIETNLEARILSRASDLPRLRSLLISVDGKLVAERYFNGVHVTQAENLKSASKSILSALVGIALDRRYFKSVHEPIERFFPEYLAGAENATKKSITIENLLTMRSGLEGTSNVNYGRWVRSGNWVRHVLA